MIAIAYLFVSALCDCFKSRRRTGSAKQDLFSLAFVPAGQS
jgi:hypothetical protein